MSSFERTLARIVRDNALLIAASDEKIVREAAIAWLPRPLRRLVDHPRLLRLYLRLPHRSRPTLLIYPDGRREVKLQ